MATIVQHEAGNLHHLDGVRFVAEQVMYDAERLGCENLTQWRWAIKSRPRPSTKVLLIVRQWPRHYPRCQFVGMPGDVEAWRAHGYRVDVEYVFSDGRLTVVGANCQVPP